MDFCHGPRVAIVRSGMIPLKRGEYFYGDGQKWADPDLDHAAELMREIRHHPRDISIGQPDLSPSTVGALYAKRLREIWEEHCGSLILSLMPSSPAPLGLVIDLGS